VPLLTAAQITQKWLTNYQGSTTAMTAGSNAVTSAPGQAAAAVAALWLQRVQASQAKWQKNVAAVTVEQWRSAYQTLGIPNGQAGANAKQGKYNTFITAYLQFLPSAVAQVKAMPKGTLQAGIARATTMITLSSQWGAARA